MNQIIDSLRSMAISATALEEGSAKILGTLFGGALLLWLIYVVYKALTADTGDKKKKKETKKKKFIKKYVPIILVAAAFLAAIIMLLLD